MSKKESNPPPPIRCKRGPYPPAPPYSKSGLISDLSKRIAALEAELAHERYLRNRDNDELVKYQKKIEAENQRLRKTASVLYGFVLKEVSADMSDDEIAEIIEPLAALLRVGE